MINNFDMNTVSEAQKNINNFTTKRIYSVLSAMLLYNVSLAVQNVISNTSYVNYINNFKYF